MEKEILKWFEQERGITAETLEAWGVRQEDDWIVFPFSNQDRLRSSPVKDGKRLFLWQGNKSIDLFRFLGDESPSEVAFIVEGETDTLRLWQALREAPTPSQGHVYGLPGINTWTPHFADYFKQYERVYVLLDNDTAYQTQQVVDKTWRDIKSTLGIKARRVILPALTKDVCEFFQKYSIENLKELCSRSVSTGSRLSRLDLNKEPEPFDWLVKDLICAGDVSLLIGNPGLGKSMMMMDLSVRIAQGSPGWAGFSLSKSGKVMYVDEENPEDIILHRFKALGLRDGAIENIHYYYRPGIWVNKEPDILLEEAVEIGPSLIVLDSLSRIHSEDENNANAMAKLFREGIVPLARETNAAVVVIHHTVKGETSSGFQRARGSGDITAVCDAAIDVQGTEKQGELILQQFKSRRSSQNQRSYIKLEEREGEILLTGNQDSLPF